MSVAVPRGARRDRRLPPRPLRRRRWQPRACRPGAAAPPWIEAGVLFRVMMESRYRRTRYWLRGLGHRGGRPGTLTVRKASYHAFELTSRPLRQCLRPGHAAVLALYM